MRCRCQLQSFGVANRIDAVASESCDGTVSAGSEEDDPIMLS